MWADLAGLKRKRQKHHLKTDGVGVVMPAQLKGAAKNVLIADIGMVSAELKN